MKAEKAKMTIFGGNFLVESAYSKLPFWRGSGGKSGRGGLFDQNERKWRPTRPKWKEMKAHKAQMKVQKAKMKEIKAEKAKMTIFGGNFLAESAYSKLPFWRGSGGKSGPGGLFDQNKRKGSRKMSKCKKWSPKRPKWTAKRQKWKEMKPQESK